MLTETMIYKAPQNTDLPEWFIIDKICNVPDSEIQDKIRLEVYNEVINRGYNLELWKENFIEKIAETYMQFFNRQYQELRS